MLSAPHAGEVWFRPPSQKLRQGDIAFTEFCQLRGRSGEAPGPGLDAVASPDLPYLGPFSDVNIEIPLPGDDDRTTTRTIRVWSGYVVVIHQSCEIDYADSNDSRLLVAPLILKPQWSAGPWELISRNELPGFFPLPGLNSSAAEALGLSLPDDMPESALALASTSLVSRAVVKPNRVVSLAQPRVPELQAALVRFFGVRGWASTRELSGVVGREIVGAVETAETVPGPSRLAKLTLGGRGGDEGDEITIAWGLRHHR
jgi:hypothetical protein